MFKLRNNNVDSFVGIRFITANNATIFTISRYNKITNTYNISWDDGLIARNAADVRESLKDNIWKKI